MNRYEGCKSVKDRTERESWIDNYESAEEKQQKELMMALRGWNCLSFKFLCIHYNFSNRMMIHSHETDLNIKLIRLYIILFFLLGSLQAKLKKRAVRTMTNLAKHFRKIDKSADGLLEKDDLKAALHEYRIDFPNEVSG